MRRDPRRWRTHFGAWVSQTTVPGVVVALQREGYPVTRTAVYGWLSGQVMPRVPVVLALVRVSRGKLTHGMIAAHWEQVRRARVAPPRS
jgi:hypothetical protein